MNASVLACEVASVVGSTTGVIISVAAGMNTEFPATDAAVEPILAACVCVVKYRPASTLKPRTVASAPVAPLAMS